MNSSREGGRPAAVGPGPRERRKLSHAGKTAQPRDGRFQPRVTLETIDVTRCQYVCNCSIFCARKSHRGSRNPPRRTRSTPPAIFAALAHRERPRTLGAGVRTAQVLAQSGSVRRTTPAGGRATPRTTRPTGVSFEIARGAGAPTPRLRDGPLVPPCPSRPSRPVFAKSRRRQDRENPPAEARNGESEHGAGHEGEPPRRHVVPRGSRA